MTRTLMNRQTRRPRSAGGGNPGFVVVHPLDDVAEGKVDVAGLGRMPLTPAVRLSLLALRVYLVLMTGLLIYHLLSQR